MQYHSTYRNPALKNVAAMVATPPGAAPANIGTPTAATTRPTQIYWLNVYNQDGSVSFLNLYNAASASAVTVSATTPDLQLALPPSGYLDNAVSDPSNGVGLVSFANGLVIAATTTVAASATGAPTNGLLVNITY